MTDCFKFLADFQPHLFFDLFVNFESIDVNFSDYVCKAV